MRDFEIYYGFVDTKLHLEANYSWKILDNVLSELQYKEFATVEKINL